MQNITVPPLIVQKLYIPDIWVLCTLPTPFQNVAESPPVRFGLVNKEVGTLHTGRPLQQHRPRIRDSQTDRQTGTLTDKAPDGDAEQRPLVTYQHMYPKMLQVWKQCLLWDLEYVNATYSGLFGRPGIDTNAADI